MNKSQDLIQDPAELHAWADSLRAKFPNQKIAVVIDQKQGAVVPFLLDQEDLFDVYALHPASAKHFRSAVYPSGAKSDPSDALLHARIFQTLPEILKQPLKRNDDIGDSLRRLTRDRRDLVGDITRVTNRLQITLKEYFPQALTLLDKRLDTILACTVLEKWNSFDSLQKAKENSIRKVFYACHHRRIDKVIERINKIRKSKPLTTFRPLIESHQMRVQRLTSELRSLLKSRDKYDAEIIRVFSEHELASIITSFPGAGQALAPRILAEVASISEPQFKVNANDLQKATGVAPIKVQSGESDIIQMRRAAPKFSRQTFMEFSEHSARHCDWAKAYRQIHEERGKSYYQIMRSLAFKWIRILSRCIETRTKYDDSLYMKQLQKTNPKLYARAIEIHAGQVPLSAS